MNPGGMRKKLLASLIVCVALLTQFGASLWGAAAARDGYVSCHRPLSTEVFSDSALSGGKGAPAGAPSTHDHASCSLCQLGFCALGGEPPFFSAEAIRFHWRVAFVETDVAVAPSVFNLNAPARAPPSRV